MTSTKQLAREDERIINAYQLLRREGIPSDMWWMLSDRLGKKQRVESTQRISFKYRYSYYAGWSSPVEWDESSSDTVWSFNNAPFYQYVSQRTRRKLPQSAFHSWAEGYANSRGIGESFLVIKDHVDVQGSKVHDVWHDGDVTNTSVYSSGIPPLTESVTPIEVLNGLGATAISRCAPNNPSSDLATFLGELREGLPHIALQSVYRDRTRNLIKNAGGEYLNYTFGWKPMVSDIKNFARSIKHSEQILEQYIRDSDRKIRRTYHFPKEETHNKYENVTFTTGSPVTGRAFLYGGTVEDWITTERWFSGAFRYHVPGGSSALDRMRRLSSEADRLLGVKLTPEVLWNLTPWTWMLDWFGNVGDILRNISILGQDGMVMQYGYMMEHKTIKRVHNSVDWYGQPVSTTFLYETKRRVPATPYGFGLDISSLTAAQSAILAALGMSRGPGAVKKPFR